MKRAGRWRRLSKWLRKRGRRRRRTSGVALSVIAWEFSRIGATAFGGQGAVLVLVERAWVVDRNCLSASEIDEAWTRARVLPGSTVVAFASGVGHRLGGWRGSLVATLAYLCPSMMLMLVLGVCFEAAPASLFAPGVVGGIKAAVAGLLLATAWKRGRDLLRDSTLRTIAGGTLLLAVTVPVHVVLLVVVAGTIGAIMRPAGGGEGRGKGR